MSAFFMSQFSYCPLILMYCNRSLNNKTDRLHEQYLRIVYSDKKSNFAELFERDGPVSFHHQNTRFLAIEMLKFISPQIVKKIFQFTDAVSYQLRKQIDFQILSVHTVFSGT